MLVSGYFQIEKTAVIQKFVSVCMHTVGQKLDFLKLKTHEYNDVFVFEMSQLNMLCMRQAKPTVLQSKYNDLPFTYHGQCSLL